ncbi:small subunit ribosomal protein S22 [Mytilus galloprovincialis]|uniref:Small subunit ribosomal protein S22 n=1 Tax=Mytilus galloprovincialis TaxID=29158 RepID=A0A8B6G750_MYTGA|nr:small subunit ribosomal protein S22 [Mytilus galloprovincialis]
MSCPNDLRIFQRLLRRTICLHRNFSAGASSSPGKSASLHNKDPLPVFLQERVQTILKQMTGFDMAKVFSFNLTLKGKKPTFALVTDEQLEEMHLKAIRKAVYKLQMPPVMKADEPVEQVYGQDPEIANLLDFKFVFTDISIGLKDRDRHVTVRDTDGSLRPATSDEKQRACQMYSTNEVRKVIMPKMFEPDHLENILHEKNYIYLLERACIQFEPDSPDFIRVCNRVYNHVAETQTFNALRSTRFFGPMTFYFAWNNRIESLLTDMIQNDLLEDAIDLIELYQIIHPSVNMLESINMVTMEIDNVEQSEEAMKQLKKNKLMNGYCIKRETDENTISEKLKILMDFCKHHASKEHAAELELSIQTYEDRLQSHQITQQNA